MGEIVVNFHGVQDRLDYEGGNYSFEITASKQQQGPSGPYVRLSLQFTEGKYAGLYTEEIVSFSGGSLWRAKQFLRAIGYEIPDGSLRIDTDDFVGLKFKAKTTREVDPEGKYPPKLRINEFHPITANLAPEGPSASSPASPQEGPKGDGAAAAPKESASPAVPVSKPKITV